MLKDNDFASLHVHGEKSLLDGFGTIDEYLNRVIDIGQTALGLTDHGNGFALYELINKARERGIIPVPGSEVYLAPQNPEGAKVKTPVFYGKGGVKNPFFDVSANGAYLHQTIWAVNNVGLKNLFQLISKSNQQEHFYQAPRIDFEMLAEHAEGLVIGTGCPSSEISTRFILDQDQKAYEFAGRLKEVFGKENLFVEVMDHDMQIDLERRLIPKQVELAKKMGLPLLATNDSHYATKEDAPHHEELLCTQSGARMSDKTYDEGGPRFAFDGAEYYLKTTQEMASLFPDEDFPGAVTNTMLIAEMAQDLSLDFRPDLKVKPQLPDGYSEAAYLQHLLKIGLRERYGAASREVKREALERVREEFEVLHSSDFIGYMLTVYEYIQWTKNHFSTYDDGKAITYPVGAGRGSVGGSIVAFLLGISEVDPIKYDLLFSRFLSAGRGATYQISYEDGSMEEIVVSEKKKIRTEEGEIAQRYVHQLREGDEVL